eukprot:jgi/Tetstr1/439047/TSEL_027538.t2
MSHFGRGMDTNLYWYDTQRTDILRECYGRELQQRGHGIDKRPDIGQIPNDQLSRMYPAPYRAQPSWSSREDMDLINRSLTDHRDRTRKQNFGKPDVTPKVGDVGVHPKSTLRLQALEEIRHSGILDMAAGGGLKENLGKPSSSRSSTRSKSKTPSEASSASKHMVAPDEWKTVQVRALPPSYFTTNGSAYCDPAPFQKVSDWEVPKPGMDVFSPHTMRFYVLGHPLHMLVVL